MKRSPAGEQKVLHHRETHWYAFLHDDTRANEIVGMNFGGVGHEDRVRREVLCDDGRSRNLWRVSYQEAMAIKKAAHNFGFPMTVFVEQGSGKPRKWVDPNIARRREQIRRKAKLLED
jgi:hypothetical protein